MYTGIPYCEFLDTSIGRCSIDNVRIKFTYKFATYDWDRREAVPSIDHISNYLDVMDILDLSAGIDVSRSYKDFFKIGAYARTACIAGSDWSCAVMIGRYCFDSACKRVAPEAVLDYNPNKVPAAVAARIVSLLRGPAASFKIVRFDVAFDIPRPRSDLVLVKDPRRSYRLFEEDGARTEYQGARGSHGALKVYDKTAEMGLSVPVSRVELTVEHASFRSMADVFPRLYCFSDYQLDCSFSSLPFQVQACVLHPDLLPLLKSSSSRPTYLKYMNLMDSLSECVLVPDDFKRIDSFVTAALSTYSSGVFL